MSRLMCGMCEVEPAQPWARVTSVYDRHPFAEMVTVVGFISVCLGCAASNFTLLDCRLCRRVVRELVNYDFGGEP